MSEYSTFGNPKTSSKFTGKKRTSETNSASNRAGSPIDITLSNRNQHKK